MLHFALGLYGVSGISPCIWTLGGHAWSRDLLKIGIPAPRCPCNILQILLAQQWTCLHQHTHEECLQAAGPAEYSFCSDIFGCCAWQPDLAGTAAAQFKVDAKAAKALREKTGAGMMDAKKALMESNGDFDKAAEYLRKKGLASADKKSGRVAAEGVVASYIHAGSRCAAASRKLCMQPICIGHDLFM